MKHLQVGLRKAFRALGAEVAVKPQRQGQEFVEPLAR
jgi:hypothetical protein